MIFEKSFIRLVLIVTLAAICIKYYNEVEANLLEKLTYRRVKQEFRCALKRRRNRITTSSQPNQRSEYTLTQRCYNGNLTTPTGKYIQSIIPFFLYSKIIFFNNF